MNLERHIAAIIRLHPNQADYCAERIVKLVEKNFTSTNSVRDAIIASLEAALVDLDKSNFGEVAANIIVAKQLLHP